MPELIPCPFCGGKAEYHSEVHVEPVIDPATGAYIDADTFYFERTGCLACDIWFHTCDDDMEGATIERWNSRAMFRPVVHAHWIEEVGFQTCSNCGEEHEWGDYRASYCEACGAKMDEVEGTE